MGGPVVERGDWSLALVTPPASEPVTLAKAKAHLRIDPSLVDDDDWVTDCITGAREYLERAYDLKVMPQRWEMRLQNFPHDDRIRFPIGPVQAIPYFKYMDTGGNITSLTVGKGSGFDLLTRLQKKPAEIVLPFGRVWPAVILQMADPIQIGLDLGYVTGASPEVLPMPGQVRQAMYLLIDHYYNNRSAVTLGSLMRSDPLHLGVEYLMSALGFTRYD